MKTLNLHCDYIRWKGLRKALKNIEDLVPNQVLEGESKDCLVVLIAVEKGDSISSLAELIDSIKKIAAEVKTKNIVIYPYAHLSSNLGSPTEAIEILNKVAKSLKGFKVSTAPFGYYKEFELKVKGHPLAELSREFIQKGDEKTRKDLSDAEVSRLLREISKAKLDTSKLKENDHRIIGNKMNLWSFNNVAPGMVFWHPKGLHIKNKLIEYWREVHRNTGYKEISTPQIMDRKLWEVSGHWKLYEEGMFTTKYEKRDFAIKPMNCPGGMLVYKTSPRSYKDLPLKVGELGVVHRNELSGTLGGLFRVIQMTQDDAHIFCTPKQLNNEIVGVLKLFLEMLKQFGFNKYKFTISTRSKEKAAKYLGDDKIWKKAEEALAKGLDEVGVKYKKVPGEAKFYGPSLDVQIEDSLGREWQCSTLQLDFSLTKRFDVTYTNEKGNPETPLMLHRVVFGSLERFIGVLTEHLDGKFPLWISPNQVKVISLNDGTNDYSKKIHQELFKEGLEVELDIRNESMGKKVRDAQIQRFNYIVTAGEREKSNGKIAVKKRDSKNIKEMSIINFIKQVKKELIEKKIIFLQKVL
jgi:threonyl-tRNA synthetase|tara:strand:+ start:3916 stop:5652 length:1737 start_codon:yes stop_codon:yes gene_type:complete